MNSYDYVACQLEDEICGCEVGTKLPNEQAIGDRFGVSRTVVREALKLLKERGLIEIQNGSGAYITKPSSDILTLTLKRAAKINHYSRDDIYAVLKLLEKSTEQSDDNRLIKMFAQSISALTI